MITHPGYSTPDCVVLYPRTDASDVIYYLRLGTTDQADNNWYGIPPSCY
jgi:hypothetical protein